MKFTLNVQNGSLAGRNFEFADGFMTIGRDQNCAVRFDPFNEKVVSGKHAYIEKKSDGFYLTDNKSTNGTFVNGVQIQTIKLNSGDTIQFGKNGIVSRVAIESNNFQPQISVPTREINFQSPQFQPSLPIQSNSQFSPATPPQNWRESMTRIGLKPRDVPPPKSQTGKYLGIAATIFVVVFLILIVTAMITSSLGVGFALIAAIVAFVPACVYILPLVWLDRYDPEPPWLLALAFAWGALVAVLISATANDAVEYFFGETASGIVSAPIFEEGTKGLGVVLILLLFRREFDDILDGIIYAGTIALGFATVENVLYYGRGLQTDGFAGLVVLFFFRGILSPFAHVTFTSMTGIGCGVARETHNKILRVLMPFVGYCAAVTLHAIWNGMAFLGGLKGFIRGYIVLEFPFFLIFVGFAIYIMRRQNRILKEMLALDVARGLITPEQLQIATSAVKSSTWIVGSIGTKKFRARQRFLRAIGKLGLSYWHIQRATAAHGQTASFQQNPVLREEVLRWRDKI